MTSQSSAIQRHHATHLPDRVPGCTLQGHCSISGKATSDCPRSSMRSRACPLKCKGQLHQDGCSQIDGWGIAPVTDTCTPGLHRTPVTCCATRTTPCVFNCVEIQTLQLEPGGWTWPKELWQVEDPPTVICGRGQVELLARKPRVAVVGRHGSWRSGL